MGVPELPEVESVRSRLDPAMRGARIDRVELRRPDLRTPFPRHFRARLQGHTVLRVGRRAKYLVVPLSSDETLVMHLGMSGSFRVEGGGPVSANSDPHDHVVFHLSSGSAVIFNDPRRFGFMDLVPAGQLEAYPALGRLGPEPLSAAFDAAALARACAGKKTSLKAALLDQCVVAGLGNIYVSEALHLARLSPQRQASTLATPTGLPRDSAYRLAGAIKQVLEAAVRRVSRGDYRTSSFRVYDREREACRQKGCDGIVRRRTQAGRSTFYCARCQR